MIINYCSLNIKNKIIYLMSCSVRFYESLDASIKQVFLFFNIFYNLIFENNT